MINLNINTLVSVIIPVYNASDTISDTITSVSEQTYPNVEIIIIDDGSTDNTIEKVKETLSLINKHHKIITQKNAGPSTARNRGIANSNGKYIAFLDADDKWIQTKIEEQLHVFNENQLCMLVGALTDEPKTKNPPYSVISFSNLIYNNCFSTSAVMCKKNLFNKYSFNPNQKYSEDYGLWLKICAEHECILLNKQLTILAEKLKFGEKGLSSNLWKMEKGELSNYLFLFKEKKISLLTFSKISLYSFMKYLIRCLITLYHKCKN